MCKYCKKGEPLFEQRGMSVDIYEKTMSVYTVLHGNVEVEIIFCPMCGTELNGVTNGREGIS
jgi:hypothetical protein